MSKHTEFKRTVMIPKVQTFKVKAEECGIAGIENWRTKRIRGVIGLLRYLVALT